MKHLSILVHAGQNNISTIVGTYEVFKAANAHWKRTTNRELFKIELVGISNNVEFENGLFNLKPHTNISILNKTDLIIIPSLNHSYEKAEKGNRLLIDWITKQYKNGAEVASMCSGAFMLAETGLLDGKICSTHWAHADNFRAKYPKIELEKID
jgi:transcriptional regulator GlxA family with amidase domain